MASRRPLAILPRRIVRTGLLLLMLMGSRRLPGVVASSSSFCDDKHWQRVWSDEFNDAHLDESVWTKDVGPPRHDSRTREAAATADSVFLQDGALVIRSNATWNGTAWSNLTSGAISSQHKLSFPGPTRVCVRAKLPGGGGRGRGIWPAHWLMPNDNSCWPCHGEIDIMEMINGDGTLHGTYHWCVNQTCSKKPYHKHSGGTLPLTDQDWSTTWHEYAVQYGTTTDEGKQHTILFAFDGVPYHEINETALVFPDVPYYAILNTAIGGPWASPPNTHLEAKGRRQASSSFQHYNHQVGMRHHTHFPTYHYVDWIRVAQPTRH